MKQTYYDIYCETIEGNVIHVDRVYSEKDAECVVNIELNQNPDADYWWEVTYADEQ